jgi:uncharacterized protein
LQSNCTLLDDKWCGFLKEHDFLVGLSIDRPKYLNDTYRKYKGEIGSLNRFFELAKRFNNHQQVRINIIKIDHVAETVFTYY